jgi:photosystem II stability/assembly factor-like uncharacterized protein
LSWLRAVYFLDQNCGWIAGSNGTLLQTVDGGARWRVAAFVTKDSLTDVYFSDEQVGWLLAQRDLFKLKSNERASYLLNTTDGGVTWRRIFLNTTEVNTRFVRLLFADAQHGWVFGETGVLFATSDGGAHWIPQRSATKHLLLGGAFTNNGRAFIVGAGGTIMQSEDSGVTWQLNARHHGDNARFNAVTAVGNLAWLVGNAGQIFATSDGGRSWSSQRANVNADLLDVKFIDAREGWAVGVEGVLLHTTDGGLHWMSESIGGSPRLERLFIVDRNHVWAVGLGGMVFSLADGNAPRLR